MIAATLAHVVSYHLLYAVICGLCLWEFSGLLFSEGLNYRLLRRFLLVALGFLPTAFVLVVHVVAQLFDSAKVGALGNLFDPGGIFQILEMVRKLPAFFFALLALLPFSLLLIELFLPDGNGFANLGKYLTGLIYLGVPLVLPHLMASWYGEFQPWTMFGILLLVWTSDVMAYLVGSRFGKRLLFPRISPKKTWEGTIGGVFCAMAVGLGLGFVFPLVGFGELEALDWLLLGLVCAVFGTLGDLVESMLKRSLNIKDSGDVLPGHGGWLDRFDALVFTLPFAVAYLFLL